MLEVGEKPDAGAQTAVLSRANLAQVITIDRQSYKRLVANDPRKELLFLTESKPYPGPTPEAYCVPTTLGVASSNISSYRRTRTS